MSFVIRCSATSTKFMPMAEQRLRINKVAVATMKRYSGKMSIRPCRSWCLRKCRGSVLVKHDVCGSTFRTWLPEVRKMRHLQRRCGWWWRWVLFDQSWFPFPLPPNRKRAGKSRMTCARPNHLFQLSLFFVQTSAPSPSGHKPPRLCGKNTPLRRFVLCLSGLKRALSLFFKRCPHTRWYGSSPVWAIALRAWSRRRLSSPATDLLHV